MKVTIIIPAYNVAEYLATSINSVKEQTHTDWECIIVDDCSTDKTVETARYYTEDDPRFSIVKNERNVGIGGSRNHGIRLAKGDAVTFLDADDWLDTDALEYLVDLAGKCPEAARIYTPYISHWEDGRTGLNFVVPYGYHPADSMDPFTGFLCDIGHATGCLYILKNMPCPFEFPIVSKFEDMLFNMELIFAGGGTFIAERSTYHYYRHYDSVLYEPMSVEQAINIVAAFRTSVARYPVNNERATHCSMFLMDALKGCLGEKKFVELEYETQWKSV